MPHLPRRDKRKRGRKERDKNNRGEPTRKKTHLKVEPIGMDVGHQETLPKLTTKFGDRKREWGNKRRC